MSAIRTYWRSLSQKKQVFLGTAFCMTLCALPLLNKKVWETEQKLAQLRDSAPIRPPPRPPVPCRGSQASVTCVDATHTVSTDVDAQREIADAAEAKAEYKDGARNARLQGSSFKGFGNKQPRET
mmetsp:Transcript_12377/g.39232  ORF Transcript_12377/g.39232 Transcript_12377/m.39232 type:complete len:125 (+) Transcript_12377:113-487(+)